MKFIPYSNGFHKMNRNIEIKPTSIIKNIFLIILVLVFIGFVYQGIVNKIDRSKISPENKYLRLDSKKTYFKYDGESKPTLIFDSNLGLGMNEWEKATALIEKEYGYRTFIYDRPGYDFSELGKPKTIQEQAQQLRLILRKVNIGGPFILVGEGYGSLIMCNFANLYPELVQGMILINPINEEALNNENYMKQFSSQKISRFTQKYGSYFGLTLLMNKLGMIKNPSGINELSKDHLNIFNIHRTKSNYNDAYYEELSNIISKKSNSQKSGLLNGKPLSIIVNNKEFSKEQESLSKLTSPSSLVQVINSKNNTDIIPLEKPELLLDSIKFIEDNTPKEEK